MKRYFLGRDNDCHWYLVDAAKRGAWNDWLNLEADDERSWEAPSFAQRLNGSHERVTFERPLEQ